MQTRVSQILIGDNALFLPDGVDIWESCVTIDKRGHCTRESGDYRVVRSADGTRSSVEGTGCVMMALKGLGTVDLRGVLTAMGRAETVDSGGVLTALGRVETVGSGEY